MSVPRDEKGRYIKGFSGHPAGRPKGKKDARTLILERYKEKDFIDKVCLMALDGYWPALHYVLSMLFLSPDELEDNEVQSNTVIKVFHLEDDPRVRKTHELPDTSNENV